MKQDATKIDPKGQTKFWVYKDVELPTGGGKKQNLAAFVVLIDENAIKPLLKDKKLTCRGTCGLRDRKVEFEALQGKLPMDLMKTVVPFYLGKPLHIPSGSDEDEKAPAPPPGGGSAPRYADLNARYKELSQQADKRIDANPESKDDLKKAMAGIPEMLQGGKLGEAKKRIDELEAKLKAPPPPPPPPAAPGGGGAPRYADLNAKWKEYQQAASKRMAANPEEADEVKKAMAGIPEMLQGGKLGEAQKRIEALRELLKIPVAPPPAPPAPAANGPGAPRYAELNATFKELSQEAAKRMAESPGVKAALTQAMAGIPEMLQGGKLGEAKKRIDQLQTLLKAPPPPPPPPPGRAPGGGSAPGAGSGGPNPAQLDAAWKELSQEANQRIASSPAQRAALTQAMAGIPELLQSGKLPEAQKRIDRLRAAVSTAAREARESRLQASTWKRLEVRVKQAITLYPEHKDELVRASSGVAEMIRIGRVPLVRNLLSNVTGLLKRIEKEAEAAKPIEQRAEALERSWKAVGADVKRALGRFPDRKDEFESLTKNIEKALEERRLDQADKWIDEASEKIGELEDEQLRFENWYSRMEAVIEANSKGGSAEAGKIRDARTMMLAAAKSGDYETALERMDALMDLIPSGPPGAGGSAG